MEGWVRAAIRDSLFPDSVDPNDPLFRAFPLVRRSATKTNVAEEHDAFLSALQG
jgi:hypothetical protein